MRLENAPCSLLFLLLLSCRLSPFLLFALFLRHSKIFFLVPLDTTLLLSVFVVVLCWGFVVSSLWFGGGGRWMGGWRQHGSGNGQDGACIYPVRSSHGPPFWAYTPFPLGDGTVCVPRGVWVGWGHEWDVKKTRGGTNLFVVSPLFLLFA